MITPPPPRPQLHWTPGTAHGLLREEQRWCALSDGDEFRLGDTWIRVVDRAGVDEAGRTVWRVKVRPVAQGGGL
jgi:hypothetical protein